MQNFDFPETNFSIKMEFNIVQHLANDNGLLIGWLWQQQSYNEMHTENSLKIYVIFNMQIYNWKRYFLTRDFYTAVTPMI